MIVRRLQRTAAKPNLALSLEAPRIFGFQPATHPLNAHLVTSER
jgi:hypothetical protein